MEPAQKSEKAKNGRSQLRPFLLGLWITWVILFFLNKWSGRPDWRLALVTFYLLAMGLGGWLVAKANITWMDKFIYVLIVSLIVGLNLTVAQETIAGPSAVVLAVLFILISREQKASRGKSIGRQG